MKNAEIEINDVLRRIEVVALEMGLNVARCPADTLGGPWLYVRLVAQEEPASAMCFFANGGAILDTRVHVTNELPPEMLIAQATETVLAFNAIRDRMVHR